MTAVCKRCHDEFDLNAPLTAPPHYCCKACQTEDHSLMEQALADAFSAARDKLLERMPSLERAWRAPTGGFRLGWVQDGHTRYAVSFRPNYGIVAWGTTTNGSAGMLARQCQPHSQWEEDIDFDTAGRWQP